MTKGLTLSMLLLGVRGEDAALDMYMLLRDRPVRLYRNDHAVLSSHVLVLSSILDLRTL